MQVPMEGEDTPSNKPGPSPGPIVGPHILKIPAAFDRAQQRQAALQHVADKYVRQQKNAEVLNTTQHQVHQV